ncbi:MAG: hypothetical protein LBT21_01440 [Oscillospiraceae bacterium]|jgi:hypothetical protein|nr:hypothetical protein [Oscillospiraceae bacterium]
MKKLLSVLLVFALILLPLAAVVTAGAAIVVSNTALTLLKDGVAPANGTTAPPATDPVTEPETEPSGEPAVTEPVTAPETVPETTPGEVTTPGTTAKPTIPPSTKAGDKTTAPQPTTPTVSADPYAPAANLNTLSKAALLAYFNKVANRVRTEKPGFKRDSLNRIDEVKLSGAASAANSLVEMVKKRLMPGEWEYETIAKGKANGGKFLSDNTNASDLRESDITGITAVKTGANWTITAKIKQEDNPAKGLASAQARVNCIATRDEILQQITDISSAISAEVSNATLTYHTGFATIVVNAKGQVVSSDCGFQVKANVKDVKLKVLFTITTDVEAPQTSNVKCHDFVW